MNLVCFNEYDFSIVELNVMADEPKRAKSKEEEKRSTKSYFQRFAWVDAIIEINTSKR